MRYPMADRVDPDGGTQVILAISQAGYPSLALPHERVTGNSGGLPFAVSLNMRMTPMQPAHWRG
jgi:hypothetical protein